MRFLNKVWHPCVDAETGEVLLCGDRMGLREGWTAGWTVVGLLSAVVLLFSEIELGEDVGVGGRRGEKEEEGVLRMWREDRKGFRGKAREWTERFAGGEGSS